MKLAPYGSALLAVGLVSGSAAWGETPSRKTTGKAPKSPAQKAPLTPESSPSTSNSRNEIKPSISNRTDREIERWMQETKEHPGDVVGWVKLSQAYLQKSRETNDPLYYTRMESSMTQAAQIQPDHYELLKLRSALHSSRHQFPEAIEWTEKAIKAKPNDAANYGILGEIYAELGEYDKMEANYQKMLDLLPGLASYARASHFQELYGDESAARATMQMAIDAGPPKGEATAWCHVRLGHLNFNGGFLPAAQKNYEAALYAFPGYYNAYMGMGKVKAAQKDYPGAIQMYQKALESGPHHEAMGSLIEIYAFTGQKDKAKAMRDRLGKHAERYHEHNMDIDFEVAEIDAEHGTDLPNALKLAKDEVKTHGNVKAYGALAWIAYLNNDLETAKPALEKSLSLGTHNPLNFYYAGKIHEKLGNKQESIRWFNRALSKSPYFHIRYASDARSSIERIAKSLSEESKIQSVSKDQ